MAIVKSVYERFGQPALPGSDQGARRHVITGGETLPQIAADEYATGYDSELWRQVAEFNGIDDLDALQVNTVLVIPTVLPSTT